MDTVDVDTVDTVDIYAGPPQAAGAPGGVGLAGGAVRRLLHGDGAGPGQPRALRQGGGHTRH